MARDTPGSKGEPYTTTDNYITRKTYIPIDNYRDQRIPTTPHLDYTIHCLQAGHELCPPLAAVGQQIPVLHLVENANTAAGITIGCDTDPPRYCPDTPVTRAQMATS